MCHFLILDFFSSSMEFFVAVLKLTYDHAQFSVEGTITGYVKTRTEILFCFCSGWGLNEAAQCLTQMT